MKTGLATRLRRLEDGLNKRVAVASSFNAKEELAKRIDQIAARINPAGVAPAECPSVAEVQALLDQRLEYLAQAERNRTAF